MEALESLVRRAQQGDTEAFGLLVLRFQAMAYGYGYSILKDFHLAEDAAQEAFVEAYRCLRKLVIPRAFPSWFRRIVLKRCDRITRRKQLATTPLGEAHGVADGSPQPAEVLERCQLREAVQRAIRSLPGPEREAVTLYYIDGYSQAEVAAFLDVPATTVKSRLHASRFAQAAQEEDYRDG